MKYAFITSLSLISLVSAEGYFCPYEGLGFDGTNDLLYDYYEIENDYWIRLNETGWITRFSYCADKADINKHSDAGETKCNDSQFTCYWSDNNCVVNSTRIPDCIELCEAVLQNKGLDCLGNCPSGYKSRNELYSICNIEPTYSENKKKCRRRKS